MTTCKCGGLLHLIEIDKFTFVAYDSFNYQCPDCKNVYGDFILKEHTNYQIDDYF